MIPATKYAYERLWKLHDHADLHEYGPDLLISDVEAVVAALATAERELEAAREDASQLRALIKHCTTAPDPLVLTDKGKQA